jgi:hypothetical protein
MVAILGFSMNPASTQAVHVGLIMQTSTQLGKNLAGYAMFDKPDACFRKYHMRISGDESVRYLILPTSAEEDLLITRTCDACVMLRMKYQRWDRLLRATPFGDITDKRLFENSPDEQGLTHAGSVSPTQILILILRECVDPISPIRPALHAINSQTAEPHDLLKALTPFARHAPLKEVQTICNDFDYVHDARDIFACVLQKKF